MKGKDKKNEKYEVTKKNQKMRNVNKTYEKYICKKV